MLARNPVVGYLSIVLDYTLLTSVPQPTTGQRVLPPRGSQLYVFPYEPPLSAAIAASRRSTPLSALLSL